MTAAELFCAIFDASPVPGKDGSFTTLSARSVEVAIIVARDRRTDGDTQTHGEKYREVIFKWAEEFAEAHARARVPRRLDVDAEEQWKEFSATLNGRCSVCGKKMQEHTLQDFLACKEKRKEGLR